MNAPVDWPALLAHPDTQTLLELALREDIGPGDVTTAAIFPAPQAVRGHLMARTATVACGGPLAAHLLRRFDPAARFTPGVPDGTAVDAGTRLGWFEADVRAVLTLERTLLNFMMRLCGVAQAAHAAVRAVAGSRAKIYDTRKTMPGWRGLDKAAVRTGGAENHRVGLFDAVLIKDNHVAAAGSVRDAVARARDAATPGMVVEVEIDTLSQLDEALQSGPDIILLDNFSDADLRLAVQRTAGRLPLEASGGVTLARLPALAMTGVDRISMGALTHSARPADLSLELSA